MEIEVYFLCKALTLVFDPSSYISLTCRQLIPESETTQSVTDATQFPWNMKIHTHTTKLGVPRE